MDTKIPILEHHTSVSQHHMVVPHRTSAILRQGLLSTRPVSCIQNYLRSRLTLSTIMVNFAGPPGTPNLHTTNHNCYDIFMEGGYFLSALSTLQTRKA
jgi:hypothetical protein